MPENGKADQGGRLALLVALVLTWTAGFVDAVGFLRMGHIYTANMSGNSVAVGIGLGQMNWTEAMRRLWPVLFYVAGVLACRLLVEIGARSLFRRIASVTFLLEILVLVPTLFAGSNASESGLIQYAVVALLALAMGMQNGSLTHFSSLTLQTGFVTGTLVKMSEQWTRFLAWLYDRMRSGTMQVSALISESVQQQSFRLGSFLAFAWCTYVVGALVGMVAQSHWSFRSLLVAIGLLLLMIAIDLYQPLARQEEKAQARS